MSLRSSKFLGLLCFPYHRHLHMDFFATNEFMCAFLLELDAASLK